MNAATPTTLSPGGTNAVGRILGLLGDEWTLLIIQQALLGATRYGEFIQRLLNSFPHSRVTIVAIRHDVDVNVSVTGMTKTGDRKTGTG